MRTTFGLLIAAACFTASPLVGAEARPRHHHAHALADRQAVLPAPPSDDAVELATLAPPTPASTVLQTYGDAAYARARLQRRIAREEQADAATAYASGGTPYPCEPRVPGVSAYACNGAPARVEGTTRSYSQGYAFTPSYLGAPQRFAVPADVQAPLLPPFTALSWAANSLRYDPHN